MEEMHAMVAPSFRRRLPFDDVTDGLPGVKAAHAALQKKGLTSANLDRFRALVEESQAEAESPEAPAVSLQEIGRSFT